jgi:hypothetical protein
MVKPNTKISQSKLKGIYPKPVIREYTYIF